MKSNKVLFQKEIPIVSDTKPTPITLDQFLKQAGIVGSGGQAKILIQAGEVLLNGVVETRRGKKLCSGDVVSIHGEQLRVP
jgi:ribosome-associated protein